MPPSPPDNGPVLLDIAAIEAGWKSEPRTRGTFSILSLCLSTIFICVWKAWHPDIPHHSPDQRSTVGGLVKSVPRFLFFLFFPEALFVTALNELRWACILCYDVHQWHGVHVKWHFRPFLRFFVWSQELISGQHDERKIPSRQDLVHLPEVTRNVDAEETSVQWNTEEDSHWTLTHSFYATMGGYAEKKDRRISVLGRNEVRKIIEQGRSKILLCISRKHILVRSRLDTFCKLIALMQIFSFCMGCLLRWINGFSLSVLEVSTIGHAMCAILAYMLWWEKPHSIMTEPTMISGDNFGTNVRGKEKVEAANDNDGGAPSMGKKNSGLKGKASRRLLRKLPTDLWMNLLDRLLGKLRKDSGEPVVMIVGSVSPAAYGLLHLLSWNGKFPTPLELTLWRISTVAVAASGIVAGVGIFLFLSLVGLPPHEKGGEKQLSHHVLGLFLLVVFLLYVTARSFMIVEAFRQLLCLPDDAYIIASWSKYIPQIS